MTSYPSTPEPYLLRRPHHPRTALPGYAARVEFLRSRSEGFTSPRARRPWSRSRTARSVFQAHAGRADFHRVVLRRHLMTADAAEAIGRTPTRPATGSWRRTSAAPSTSGSSTRPRRATPPGRRRPRAMPLWFGIVPDEHRERALSGLIEQIGRDGGHLSTGTWATPRCSTCHRRGGRGDVRIASRPPSRAGGHQVERGATTVWETWGGDHVQPQHEAAGDDRDVPLQRRRRAEAGGPGRAHPRPAQLTHRLPTPAPGRATPGRRGDRLAGGRTGCTCRPPSPGRRGGGPAPCGGLDDPRLTWMRPCDRSAARRRPPRPDGGRRRPPPPRPARNPGRNLGRNLGGTRHEEIERCADAPGPVGDAAARRDRLRGADTAATARPRRRVGHRAGRDLWRRPPPSSRRRTRASTSP